MTSELTRIEDILPQLQKACGVGMDIATEYKIIQEGVSDYPIAKQWQIVAAHLWAESLENEQCEK